MSTTRYGGVRTDSNKSWTKIPSEFIARQSPDQEIKIILNPSSLPRLFKRNNPMIHLIRKTNNSRCQR